MSSILRSVGASPPGNSTTGFSNLWKVMGSSKHQDGGYPPPGRRSPPCPRGPAVLRVQEGLLGLQDPLPLERRDRGHEFALAIGEVMEQLAATGRGPRADVVQAGRAHSPGQYEVSRRLDDARAGR